jgi:hypothetical protein
MEQHAHPIFDETFFLVLGVELCDHTPSVGVRAPDRSTILSNPSSDARDPHVLLVSQEQ